ncbi:cation/H(+) antiporter 19 [Senna tora]|uniref:Cation/H(+) antiporter 19 n=1 Tax=Senna tora TaxID=362788 RepID=A0A834X1S5_9FABA|nr:cation/H(+) antiporter 19 [Senna tora]
MVIAFQAYGQLNNVNVRPMTAISALSSIYEDICTSAHLKRVAMIVLPFHKHQRVDGSMESLGHSFRVVNELVLAHAPCSVGILVDRGFGGHSQVQASEVSYKVMVPFFGGRDDREALAYGMRMAEHPGIELSVVKFVPLPGNTLMFGVNLMTANQDNKVIKEGDHDKQLEEDSESLWSDFVNVCKSKQDESIKYEEKVVGSKAEVLGVLKEMNKSNLVVVGRMPPVAPLVDISDCKELGPVGTYLASSDFSATTSVLVLQQYNPSMDLQPLVIEVSDYPQVPDTPRDMGEEVYSLQGAAAKAEEGKAWERRRWVLGPELRQRLVLTVMVAAFGLVVIADYKFNCTLSITQVKTKDSTVDANQPDLYSGGGGSDHNNGEGESDGNKKKMAISMSQKFTLGYAALLGVGGVMGYLKGGSQKSLLAGGLSASLLYYVYTELPERPVLASSVGLGISGALTGMMGARYKRTGKVFPAGVVSLVSLVMTGGYLHGIWRGMH